MKKYERVKYNKTRIPKRIERLTLNIDCSDIVIFRGDLVHAGSGYENENYRLHAYMDSPKVPRTINRTWLIAKHANDLMKQIIIT